MPLFLEFRLSTRDEVWMMFWLLLCTLPQVVIGFTNQKTSTSRTQTHQEELGIKSKSPNIKGAILKGTNLNVKILLLTQQESKVQNKWSMLAATLKPGNEKKGFKWRSQQEQKSHLSDAALFWEGLYSEITCANLGKDFSKHFFQTYVPTSLQVQLLHHSTIFLHHPLGPDTIPWWFADRALLYQWQCKQQSQSVFTWRPGNSSSGNSRKTQNTYSFIFRSMIWLAPGWEL